MRSSAGFLNVATDEICIPWASSDLDPVQDAAADKENAPPPFVNVTAVCPKDGKDLTYPLRLDQKITCAELKAQVEFDSARVLRREELLVMTSEDGEALPEDETLALDEGAVVLLRQRSPALVNVTVFVPRSGERPEEFYEIVVREELDGAELRRAIEAETNGELKPQRVWLDEERELADREVTRLEDAQMIIVYGAGDSPAREGNGSGNGNPQKTEAAERKVGSGILSRWFRKSKPAAPAQAQASGLCIHGLAGLKVSGETLTCNQEPAVAIFEVVDQSFFELAALPLNRTDTQWMLGVVPADSQDEGEARKAGLKTPAQRKALIENRGYFFSPNNKDKGKYTAARQTLTLHAGEVLALCWLQGELHARPGDREPIKFMPPMFGERFRPCIVLLQKGASVRLVQK